MTEKYKVTFFDENLEEILRTTTYEQVNFMHDYINHEGIKDSFKRWPDEIKILIVNSYLKTKLNSSRND